jgi:NAD+ synthase/NAD+ synthase (glutamine-hydrolysing)
MRIAILQLNFTVGDIAGNAEKIVSAVKNAGSSGIDLFITSELALTGYPPRDLLLNKTFIEKTRQAASGLAKDLMGYPPLIVGFPEANASGEGKPLYNSAVLLKDGEISRVFRKTLLPTYDVFDEYRYFEPSDPAAALEIAGSRIGVTICEDIWNDRDCTPLRLYRLDPLEKLFASGIDCIVNISASPFFLGKQKVREEMLGKIAAKYKTPLVYVNQCGGNDDLVFDGRSCVFSGDGKLSARAKPFREDTLIVDVPGTSGRTEPYIELAEEEAWEALVMGTRDYAAKCGFKKVLLGLSGGIDSALTAAIAAEALGKENVFGVLMPSPYSSKGSIDDALALVRNLGINGLKVPIKNVMSAFAGAMRQAFKGYKQDITEENIQSRIRGNILMALSNKYGALLLTTGNKSELAVGYCTIYGDMSGGLAVIADVSKTMVYRIANWLNNVKGGIIPQNSIDKAPSAELRPNQTDQDSLPPYDLLDKILYNYIELHKSADEIIAMGLDKETVVQILYLVRKAEFKRKQAAPGIKITDCAFGTGWRMPIAAKHNLI